MTKRRIKMDIVEIIRTCDSWGEVERDDSVYGSYFVKVRFDKKDDAKEFAVELMMVTSGQEPYGEAETEAQQS